MYVEKIPKIISFEKWGGKEIKMGVSFLIVEMVKTSISVACIK